MYRKSISRRQYLTTALFGALATSWWLHKQRKEQAKKPLKPLVYGPLGLHIEGYVKTDSFYKLKKTLRRVMSNSEAATKVVLVTGRPGNGKTCAVTELLSNTQGWYKSPGYLLKFTRFLEALFSVFLGTWCLHK